MFEYQDRSMNHVDRLPAVTEKKEAGPAKATAAPVKPRKAPVKALPQMMEEDVIPSLKSTLEAEEDLSLIELSF